MPIMQRKWSPTRSAARLLAVLTATAVTGCADTYRWEKPGVDMSIWANDQSACRRDAERRAAVEQERELSRFETIDGRSGTGGLQRDMIRYDAKRYAARLYADCLRARGYQKVKHDAR